MSKRKTGVTGIVIGGGQSKRLGTSKPMVQLGGKLVLARVADALRPLCDELVFVAREGQTDNSPDTAIALRMHVVTDTAPYHGPLAALHAGLSATVTPLAFVIGADYPFLSRKLIEAMTAAARSAGPEPESVAARIGGRVQPLHSVLAVAEWREAMGTALVSGEESPSRLMQKAMEKGSPGILVMTEDEVERYDPRLLSFFDLDTPEQLAIARRLLDSRHVYRRLDIAHN